MHTIRVSLEHVPAGLLVDNTMNNRTQTRILLGNHIADLIIVTFFQNHEIAAMKKRFHAAAVQPILKFGSKY